MRWRRNPRVLWRTAPGYLALAAVDGRSIEVSGPGGDVWAQLSGWVTEEELAATLAHRYGTNEREVLADVQPLLRELHAQGYVDRNG